MAEPSAEANMIRDEIRASLRHLDSAVQRVASVLEHAEHFVRGERQPPSIQSVQTPARRASGSDLRTPAARPGATEIREK